MNNETSHTNDKKKYVILTNCFIFQDIVEKLNQALRDCKTKNNLQYDSDSQTPDKNS